MKRFRDATGRVTLTVGEIARQTKEEADTYYQNGCRYQILWPGQRDKVKVFVCRRFVRLTPKGPAEVVSFNAEDGSPAKFTTGADMLGFFFRMWPAATA